MFKKTVFGAAKTNDGYIVRPDGRNTLLLKKGRKKYYMFFEYQNTNPITVQLDQSGVWIDEAMKTRLEDRALEESLILKGIEYFKFVGIGLV